MQSAVVFTQQMLRWGAVCMAGYLYTCYLSSATGLLEMLWLTLRDEDHILSLENCFFFFLFLWTVWQKKEMEPMRWDDWMSAASVLYHRTNDLYVLQERWLQITAGGPIDLLTELNALQQHIYETYILLAHVKIPLMLSLTDIGIMIM